MIVDEFITLLSLDVHGMTKGERFKKQLGDIEKLSKSVIAGISKMIAAITTTAGVTTKLINDNYEWAKSAGMAIDSYQKFQHAAAMVGGDLDSIKGDLEGWIRAAKVSGQSLEEIFMKEAASIENLSAEEARAFLNARGYSETAIRLIQQGTGKLQQFFANAEIIPEEDLKAAQDYTITWRQTISQLTRVFQSAVASAMPIIQSLLKGIRDFIDSNKELIRNSISSFFKTFAAAALVLYNILKPIVWLLAYILRFLDFITLGLAKYIALILAVVAVVATFIVSLTNLLLTFSKFGPVFQYSFKVIKIFSGLLKTHLIPTIWAAVKATWAWTASLLANPITWVVLAIIALIAAIALLIVYWDKVAQVAQAAWDNIADFAEDAWEKMKKLGNRIKAFLIGIWDDVKKAAISFWNYIADLMTFQINMHIKVLNYLIKKINSIPGVNISTIDELDWKIKNPTGEQQSLGQYMREQQAFRPKNTVPVSAKPMAVATTSQMIDNSRAYNYTDNRNITIQTTATSAPALANRLEGTNDMMANGYGQGGYR